MGCIYMHDSPEDYDTIIEREQEYGWRSMLNGVFHNVANNTSIRTLDILDLPPKGCSTFYSEEWTTFLNSLEDIKLELWAGDNGAGWHSNTTEGYLDFISDLSGYFFDHLTAIRRLEFVADPENPVGCEGMRHSPLPIKPTAMENIKHITLHNCFLDTPLTGFLASKSQHLETLHLLDCFSGHDSGLAENGISWSEFLKDLRETKPLLTELIVLNTKIPLTSDEEFNREPKKREPEDVKAIRETLQNDSQRRLFSYVALDDKYGMVFKNEEKNVESFEDGDDQREYDAMMELVASNRVKVALPPEYSGPCKSNSTQSV
jgi:hypothetical protein